MMSKQEIINELSKLYCLQREGKKVKALIADLEQQLSDKCDEELDAKAADEKNQKNGKKVKHG